MPSVATQWGMWRVWRIISACVQKKVEREKAGRKSRVAM
jgi:hypothetical protein